MDYFEILKRAWNVTWKYKALWVLGLFAGVGSGGGGGSGGSGSNFNTGTGDPSPAGEAMAQTWLDIERWVVDNVALVAVIAAAFVIFGLVMWVLSIAAQGGLIHLVNEAEERREVRLGTGWSVGFRYWGRNFMIGLVLGLPLLIVIGVLVVLFVLPLIGLAGASSEAAAAGGITTICCGLPMLIVVIAAASVFVALIGNLAMRYAVLDDITFGEAIKTAWRDLWAKRGVWIMWLVMMLPGFAYTAVVGVVSLLLILPAIFMLLSGKLLTAVVIIFLVSLVLLVPGAIYGTFISASWTIFFRRMTGKEVVTTNVPAPFSYTPAPPTADAGFAPPPPFAEPEPPAAPAPIVDVPPAPAPIVDVPPAPEPPADA